MSKSFEKIAGGALRSSSVVLRSLALAVVVVAAFASNGAYAQLNPPLKTVGPVIGGGHPFPSFYMDSAGVALEPCLAAGCALVGQPGPDGTNFNPVNPVAWKTNFPGEVFYQSVQTFLPVFGVAKGFAVAMNVEATFLPTLAGGSDFNSANPVAFTRIRFTQLANKQGSPPVNFIGTYKITYPYGTFTTTADAAGSLFPGQRQATIDVPAGLVGNFTAPVAPPQGGAVPAANIIGTFLSSVTAVPPFIGDGVTPTAIVGSPTGTNFFRIERIAGGAPGDSGDLGLNCPTLPAQQSCAEIASFIVTGKKANGGPATHLTVTGLAAGLAGTAQTVVVKAVDANGLPDFNFAGTVALTSVTDPSAVFAPASAPLVQGVGSFTVTPKAVGQFTVTATDQSATPITPGVSLPVTIAPILQIDSGNGQTGTAAAALTNNLVVKAVDGAGNPVAGVTVNFTASTGSVNPTSFTTLADGLAPTAATLGTVAGPQTFTASAGASQVTFNATAGAGALASLAITGLPASTVAGQTVTVTVSALDASGNTVTSFNGPITFAASDASPVPPLRAFALGTGTFSVAFHTAGNQTVTASSVTPALSKTASTTVAAGAASAIAAVSGSGQTATVGSILPSRLVVKVTDAFGNTVSGTSVVFQAPVGGNVSPASFQTLADGLAQTTATLATGLGAQTFTATAIGLTGSPVSFTETASAPVVGVASVIKEVSGSGQTATVGSTLPVVLAVEVTDFFGSPVAGTAVDFVAPAGGRVSPLSARTGTDGVAKTEATLSPDVGAQTFTATAFGVLGSQVSFAETAVAVPVAPAKPASGGCSSGAAGGPWALLGVAASALLVRRRRR